MNRLSPRLEAILSYTECRVLADIGCDHAYVPVAACLRALSERAIACDIRPGPLRTAFENIRAHGLVDRIETRLGGGLAPIAPGEADCAVIAGMGGMRIIDILQEYPETAKSFVKLILQPQHDLPRLRKSLHDLSFDIDDECMVREENRFYTVLLVHPCAVACRWSETEYLLGRHLLAQNDAVFRAYLQREAEKISQYASQSSCEPNGEKFSRLRALSEIYQGILHI